MKCWSLLAGAALAVLAPAEAAAFQRSVVQGTQVCLFWEGRNLPWSLNDRGSEEVPLDQVQAALRSSYATWEAVDCSDVQFAVPGVEPSELEAERTRGAVLVDVAPSVEYLRGHIPGAWFVSRTSRDRAVVALPSAAPNIVTSGDGSS